MAELFNRNSPDTVNNALYKSLLEFKSIYKNTLASEEKLEEAYQEIRKKASSGFKSRLSREVVTDSSHPFMRENFPPEVEVQKVEVTESEKEIIVQVTAKVNTPVEKINLTGVLVPTEKKPKKSEMITNYLLQGLTSKEVVEKLKQEEVIITKSWADEILASLKKKGRL